MSLDPKIRSNLSIPAICAPMFLVTGPALVREACKAGVIGGLPRQNARDLETFEAWLAEINTALTAHREAFPNARIAPIAVNYPTRMAPDDLAANMALCQKYGVEIIISVGGDPTELVARVHDFGGKVFHDITSLRFAERPSRPVPTASTASARAAAATRARSATWRSSPASAPSMTEPL